MAYAEDIPRHGPVVPCFVDMRVSPSACSISGNPPFTVITSYTCTRLRPIYVIVSIFTDFCNRIVLHDPNHARRKDGRIGCWGVNQDDEWDQEIREFEEASLVRLEPREIFETTYTFYVKEGQLRHSDTHYMKPGGMYWAELGERKCWWMYADETDENLTEKEIRDRLRLGGRVEWKPSCRIDFMAVE